MAYAGKYPHRIASVASQGRFSLTIQANNGERLTISNHAAVRVSPRLPQLGADIRDYRQMPYAFDVQPASERAFFEAARTGVPFSAIWVCDGPGANLAKPFGGDGQWISAALLTGGQS